MYVSIPERFPRPDNETNRQDDKNGYPSHNYANYTSLTGSKPAAAASFSTRISPTILHAIINGN